MYQETVHYKLNETEYDTRTYVTNTYDAADRLIKTTDLDGKETHYEYDKSGNLIEVTDANGHTTRYEYDAMNRQTAIIDANGNRTETVYDLAGRVVQSINANGNITAFEYDALGRKTKEITPLGFETHYEYDNNGNLTHLTDANALAGLQPKNSYNATIYNEYDEFNRLEKTVDARDGETRYTYDLLGNMTGVTDAEGRTSTFVYDGLGRLRQVIDPIHEIPEDKTTTFTYDEAGNRLSQTDRTGRMTEYTYDELNRITNVELTDDDITIRYDYNSYGDPSFSSVYNFVHTNQYDILMRSFDDLHRPTARNDFRFGVGAKNMSWDYDAVGNIRTKTGYEGDITEYQYDSANRLVAMRNQNYLQASYHYDPAGRLLDRILSNQAKTSYKYDDDNRLTQLKNTSAGDKYSHTVTYTHDNIGNILTATDASGTITYTYDALYRLTGADYPGTADDRTYTYDGVGNRLTLTTAEGTLYYLYNNAGNRLDEVRQDSETGPLVYSFVYDDNGNCIEKRDGSGRLQMSFDYDQRNRMTAVQYGENAEPLSSYYYNADGYRTAKGLADGDPRRYYLEGESIEMVYTNGQSTQFNPKSSYLRGVVVDEVVNGYDYDAQGDKTNYTFHHDHLQSVTGLTGHNGDEIETVMYAPFGEIIDTVGTGSNDLGYTGRELDPETGMYYYRARYYDPKIGRFLGEDPLGFEAGVNFYTYVLNNPINFNDPTGHDVVTIGPKIAVSGWVAKAIQKTYEFVTGDKKDIAVSGMGAGIALSFPGLSGGEWDVGAYFTMDVNNNSLIAATPKQGVAKLTGQLGYKVGSVRDLRNMNQFEVSAQAYLYGGGVEYSYDDNFQEQYVSGVQFSFGPGAIAGISATPTTALSFRDVQNWFNKDESASGGFVLYPNKSNTNMLQSVYKK
nr:RHS repeat-associated core domain-containing protein [uncultured Desulfobacter sp.]